MRWGNSIYFADLSLRDFQAAQVSYLQNLGVGEFGYRAIHAPIIPICSVSGSVQHIFTMSTPGKIFERAVGGNPVTMPTFHSRGTGTDKGFQNEPVNQKCKVLSVFGQSDLQIGFARRTEDFIGIAPQNIFRISNPSICGPNNLSMPVRPHAALIGNIISGEVRNWFPNFFGGVKILAIHGVALLDRVILGREPFRCSSTVAARFIYNKSG